MIRGCTRDAERDHFAGSPYPTRRCVRKQMDSVPYLYDVASIWAHTDGQLGPEVMRSPASLVRALGVISEGHAWSIEQQRDRK